MRWIDQRCRFRAWSTGGGRRLSGAAQPQLFLELRGPRRDRPGHPDRHRDHPGDALRALRPQAFRRSSTSCATSTRAGCSLPPRQRRRLLLHRHLHPIFRGLYYGRTRRRASWSGCSARHPPADDGDGVHGLRLALGADELLGVQGDHRPVRAIPLVGEPVQNWLLGGSRRTSRRSTASSRFTICFRS